MERMTAGTRQGHGSTQASASLFQANKKMARPNGFLTSRSHAIVNVVNNERIAQRAADTRDPAARPVIFVLG